MNPLTCSQQKGTILKGNFIFQASFLRGKKLRTVHFQGSTITPKAETTIVSSMVYNIINSTYNYDLCLPPHISKTFVHRCRFLSFQAVWWLQAAATLIMGMTTGIVGIFCLLHSYPPVQQVGGVEGQRCQRLRWLLMKGWWRDIWYMQFRLDGYYDFNTYITVCTAYVLIYVHLHIEKSYTS